MTKKHPTFADFKKEAFKDPKFKLAYEQLQPTFDLINQFIIARKSLNLSQQALARKLHTKQPAIARFEGGGYAKTSLDKLQAYANAIGYELNIQLIPKNNDDFQDQHRQ